MINLTNYIIGGLISLISLFIMNFSSSLKSQYVFIKNHVLISNLQEIQIPKQLINSIVIIEDKRFYYHLGIDFYSMIRAIIRNTTTTRLEGASTIVQQFVRNVTGQREILLKRKIKEIVLATIVNNKFTKEEILIAYLNTYRFNNCVGIFSFCKNENYNINNLTYNESAQIAARLKYPHLDKSNYIKYLKRVRTIELKQENL